VSDSSEHPPGDDSAEAQYRPEELQRIKSELIGDRMPECPRCSVKMTRRAIGGGSFGLGYARKRDWLICPKCKRSAVFDVERGTRN